MQTVPLISDPAAGGGDIEKLEATVDLVEARLALTYTLQGRIASLRIQDAPKVGRADGLWRHTCFEAFIGVAGRPEYYEFNFAPSGQWAAYRFADYRTGMEPLEIGEAPEISVRRESDRFSQTVRLDLGLLPAEFRGQHARLSLTAVIEAIDGSHHYWAVKHCQKSPDFHRSESFTVPLVD